MKPYVTFSDYLEAERSSDIKHEWFMLYVAEIKLSTVYGSRGENPG